MKRLVLYAASTVVSCSSLVLITGGASVLGAPATTVTGSGGTFLPAPGEPRIHASRGAVITPSTNWSGYVQEADKRHTFTEVTDTFVVPTVEAVIPGNQYAADWVGIGGYTDGTLVQTGIQTEVSTINGTSKVTYSAWTEILPQPEKPLPHFTVSAGDTITATVLETTKNRWLMEVDDVTTGQTGSRTVRYVAKGLSAEAIHERPCLKVPCSVTANLATLAQTSDVTFDPGFFSVAAAGTPPVEVPLLTDTPSVAFPDLDLYNVVMQVGDGGTVLATPSSPNAPADDGFSLADGSVAPLPPTA